MSLVLILMSATPRRVTPLYTFNTCGSRGAKMLRRNNLLLIIYFLNNQYCLKFTKYSSLHFLLSPSQLLHFSDDKAT